MKRLMKVLPSVLAVLSWSAFGTDNLTITTTGTTTLTAGTDYGAISNQVQSGIVTIKTSGAGNKVDTFTACTA